jgi:hypothetical protein
MILAIVFRPFGLLAPKTLNYLAFQYFDLSVTWWRLFQKHVVRTKFDIYVLLQSLPITTDFVGSTPAQGDEHNIMW